METKLDNNFSYLLGFLQSDGHRSSIYSNGLRIEISNRDRDILEKIKDYFFISSDILTRTRDTNFKDDYTSCSLYINGTTIANIIDFIPIGSKSEIVSPPSNKIISEIDYWRGFIDGDGSMGFRKTFSGKIQPFISIGTNSEFIARAFEQFIFYNFYSKNESSRNKRDNSFNITIGGYFCPPIVEKLYYPECLSLNRKMMEAISILQSNYLSTQKRIPFSRNEDILLLEHKNSKDYALPDRIKSVSKRRLKYLLERNINTIDKLFDIGYFV